MVTDTDVAGNTTSSTTLSFTLDTSVAAPAATLTNDTGSSNTDKITKDASLTFSVAAETVTRSFMVDSGAASAIYTAPTGEGSHTVVVTDTDVAGNVASSSTLTFTLDTIAPAKGVITNVVDNSGSTSDTLTNDSTPVITITAETGMRIVLNQNGTAVDLAPHFYTAVETSTPGTYTVTLLQPLADDGYGLLVKDVAGNSTSLPPSGTSDPAKFKIDTTAPSEPGITAIEVNSGSTSDRVTSDTTPVLTVAAESGANLLIGQNGVAIDSSLYTVAESGSSPGTYTITVGPAGLAEGGYGLVAIDAAGNKSATPVSGSAATFLIDATAPAKPSITAIDANSGSTTDLLTNDKAPALTVTAETKSYLVLGTVSGGNFTPLPTQPTMVESGSTAGTYTVTVNSDLADGSYVLRAVDQAGNASSLPGIGDSAGFAIDSVAPGVTMMASNANPTTGAVNFDFVFDEAVTGFDASDVTVTGGTKGAFTAIDTSHYTLAITPTSSSTPQALIVDVANGVAADAAGNANTAAAQFLTSVLYGTSGADTLTVGSAMDHIFLGGGSDVVKFASATGSTVASTDNVMDVFGAGDKIDLSTLLGTGGSGYTGTALGDSGAGFVEIKNLTLAPSGSNTLVQFNIHFDAATIGSSKITGAVIDLAYTYSAVSNSQTIQPTFSYSDGFGGTATANVWSQIQSNLSVLSSVPGNGKIAVIADTSSDNTIIDGNSNVMQVRLLISGSVSTFGIGLESRANGGDTYITTADGQTHNVDVGITKTAGVTVGATGTLEIITDTNTLGPVGDNQLHMASSFDATSNMTHLQVQYDTNSTFGATALSSIIALDFDGDVRANLTPASLTYI